MTLFSHKFLVISLATTILFPTSSILAVDPSAYGFVTESQTVQPVTKPVQPIFVEPAILTTITKAKELLAKAPALYPKEKNILWTRSLTKGTEGSDVELLQETLKKHGYFPKNVTINGTYGPTTEAAVKAFQKANGIEQNGIVGPMTTAALKKKGFARTLVSTSWTDTVPEDREVLLAVWNPKTNDMKTVQITLDSTTTKNWLGKKSYTYKAISKTKGFTVQYSSGNGVNTQYTVTSPAGYQVLANRFPIFDAAPLEKGNFPPVEETYVPFQAAYITPDMVTSGRNYLDSVVDRALADLRKRGVQSVSGTGLVVDQTDTDELKNIAIIEHVDHQEFYKATDKKAVVNKVFTILALNREEAYRFSGSSAGALGLGQFMETTYNHIVARYPSAGLIPDFKAGMADHVNTFKAMALYNDTTNDAIKDDVKTLLSLNADQIELIMADIRAAAYNSGAARVKTAVKKFKDAWKVASGSNYALPAETRTYLEKFQAVRDVLNAS